MEKRNWTGKEKLEVVLEGMRGTVTLTELCNRHQITQGMYYKWKDRLMADGSKIFERGGMDKESERLKEENLRLKRAVGELTLELKKNDW